MSHPQDTLQVAKRLEGQLQAAHLQLLRYAPPQALAGIADGAAETLAPGDNPQVCHCAAGLHFACLCRDVNVLALAAS